MLYVTTRNNRDAYTARRALCENRGPDGGFFVPFREPFFSADEIMSLKEKSFNGCIADVLNRLFNSRMTAYDIDFAIGRYAFRLQMLGQRLVAGECWHNLEADFSRIVKNITALLRNDSNTETEPGNWAEIGIRIAVLFGIFGELMRQGLLDGDEKIDITLVSGDFSGPISAWYAKRWGLPIGNIVCCCNDNGNLWDFICHGTLRTNDVAVATSTPAGDIVVPPGLERLIYTVAGPGEVEKFLDAVRRGSTYYLDDSLLHRLRQGLYVTVTSDHRVLSMISKIFSTHRYLLSPYSALAYAGLQDYRSRTGESRPALLLAEKSPLRDAQTVASALNISVEALEDYFK